MPIFSRFALYSIMSLVVVFRPVTCGSVFLLIATASYFVFCPVSLHCIHIPYCHWLFCILPRHCRMSCLLSSHRLVFILFGPWLVCIPSYHWLVCTLSCQWLSVSRFVIGCLLPGLSLVGLYPVLSFVGLYPVLSLVVCIPSCHWLIYILSCSWLISVLSCRPGCMVCIGSQNVETSQSCLWQHITELFYFFFSMRGLAMLFVW